MPRRRGKIGKTPKREFIYKEEGQDYAQILRLLGNGRVECNCLDAGKNRICTIGVKLRKVRMNAGDLILVRLKDSCDDIAVVIHKYYPEEAYEL